MSLVYSYARLVVLSYAFQNAFDKGQGQQKSDFFQCVSSISILIPPEGLI